MSRPQNSRPRRLHAAGWTLLALLAGCQAPPSEPAPEPDASTAPAPAPAEDPRIAPLLDAAQRAFDADRLLNPPFDSAYTHYRKVLDLDPANAQARLGVEAVVERYLELARTAADRRHWATARSMLDRAGIVDADHPAIGPMRAQVEMLAAAKRLVLNLSHDAVRRRAPEAARKLADFGVHARRRNVRVMIRAGSDAQGRWMYEQLNRAPGDARIRAAMEIGRPPQVVVLVLPDAASVEPE